MCLSTEERMKAKERKKEKKNWFSVKWYKLRLLSSQWKPWKTQTIMLNKKYDHFMVNLFCTYIHIINIIILYTIHYTQIHQATIILYTKVKCCLKLEKKKWTKHKPFPWMLIILNASSSNICKDMLRWYVYMFVLYSILLYTYMCGTLISYLFCWFVPQIFFIFLLLRLFHSLKCMAA